MIAERLFQNESFLFQALFIGVETLFRILCFQGGGDVNDSAVAELVQVLHCQADSGKIIGEHAEVRIRRIDVQQCERDAISMRICLKNFQPRPLHIPGEKRRRPLFDGAVHQFAEVTTPAVDDFPGRVTEFERGDVRHDHALEEIVPIEIREKLNQGSGTPGLHLRGDRVAPVSEFLRGIEDLPAGFLLDPEISRLIAQYGGDGRYPEACMSGNVFD